MHSRGPRSRAVASRHRFSRFIAGGAAAALVAGGLVTAGVGAQMALAAGLAPTVGAGTSDSYIAGEDLTLNLTFTGTEGAGAQYNLGAGVLLDADVEFVSAGALLGGLPASNIHGPGTRLSPVIPISAEAPNNTCAALGLEGVAESTTDCQVPVGKQYWVFQNIADLPEGATLQESLTVRPKADTFPVGAEFAYQVNAYTSSEPRYLPVFPGSTGTNSSAAATATSNVGIDTTSTQVNALRIEKVEPSAESELLRGVHQNSTTYTLRLWHTGENDVADATVVDYLPAGLEYLGLGGTDNTSDANGTRGEVDEYPSSGDLTGTPAPDGIGSWQTSAGERVETVAATSEEAEAYGLVAGAVYTKVTWNLGTLLANGDARASETGVQQVFSGTAGTPGLIEISYRAAVPLFENTLDFDGEGGQPDPESLEQVANLDNNRGASTRHGSDDLTADAAAANVYTNVAVASGTYDGERVEDFASEDIHAVDVRLLKSTGPDFNVGSAGLFQQGELAQFRLELATSEYVRADLGDPDDAGDPLRLVDEMGNGLCPVFPAGTKVWNDNAYPNLVIGNYNSTPPVISETGLTPAEWNAYLDEAGVSETCQWGSDAAHAHTEAELSGAALAGIAFDPDSGRFVLEFMIDPVDALDGPNKTHQVDYWVHQNVQYVDPDNEDGSGHGATGAQDRFENSAEVNARTTPIDELEGVESADGAEADSGPWNAWDDSSAWAQAAGTDMTKQVLQRSAGVPDRENIADQAESDWVRTPAQNQPFTVGDEAWYRIEITPPAGADVRNAVFTDFLPQGVEFDLDTIDDDTQRPADLWIVPGTDDATELLWIGDCQPDEGSADDLTIQWLNEFVPHDGMRLDGQSLSFALGSSECFSGTDRFFPFEATLEIYLKVTITDPSAFAEVDLAANLAKFQYQNVAGDIFALRDQAEIELDRSPRLIKGIKTNTHTDGSSDRVFDSNVDGERVAQGSEVTFRLDVTAPYTETNDYVIYDLLPVGISAADIDTSSYTAATAVLGDPTTETELTSGYSAQAYDYGESGYPSNIKGAADHQRSVIVWTVEAGIEPSTKAVTDEDGEETDAAVDRGFTLGYTLTVPYGAGEDGAILNQHYVNDASIARFDAVQIDRGDSRLFVDGSENFSIPPSGDLPEGQFVFTDSKNDTSDPSDIRVVDGSMAKRLISTEVGPDTGANPPAGEHQLDANNGDAQIVQGELATFELEVTVPAHSTVRDGRLADDQVLRWTGNPNVTPPGSTNRALPYTLRDAAVWNAPGVTNGEGTLAAGWAFDEDTGTLDFPEYYQNASNDEVKIQVRLTVWIDARDASHPNQPSHPNFDHGKSLQNTARFTSLTETGAAQTEKTANAGVNYITPAPNLQKRVSDPAAGVVRPGGTAKYTLTVTNSANRPALYDSVVYDCVPELLTDPGDFAPASADVDVTDGCELNDDGTIVLGDDGLPQNSGPGTLITWTLTDPVLGGGSATLEYTVNVADVVGGGQELTNGARLEGFTLPSTGGDEDATERRGDRVSTASEDVTVTTAYLDKSVEPEAAPVGDTVEYTLTTTLPADANYYDVELTDTLPVGLEYVAGSASAELEWADASNVPTVGDDGEPSSVSTDGRTLSWNIVGDDIATHDKERQITLMFRAKVTADIVSSTPRNTALFSWNSVNGNDDTRQEDPAEADFTIQNPVLDIEKLVEGEDEITRNPDATFDYGLTVTNHGDADAHHITVVDQIPDHVIVDPDSITPTGVLEGASATGGGTITWTIDGPLAVDASVELGYTAAFAPSSGLTADDFPYTNIVNVTKYESFEADGWEYTPPTLNRDGSRGPAGEVPGGGDVPAADADAMVTPLFPNVVPEKSVTNPVEGEDYGVAVAGESFGWTLAVTNDGAGTARSITVTDELPLHWSYDAGSAQIGGVALPDPEIVTDQSGSTGQTFTWTAQQLADAGVTPLDAGDSFEITFTATPSADALTSPGTGIGNEQHVHRNTLSVTATDTTDAPENGDGDYVEDDSTADAFMAEADLRLEKTTIGGVVDTGSAATNLYGLDAGTWVSGQGVKTDAPAYEQPQWQITVVNQGPDAAEGPFVFADDTTEPDGVTTGAWSARYFANAADTEGTPLALEETADGFIVSGADLSLKADGSDRIVVVADVTIESGATAAGNELYNIASVVGETYESDENIEKDNEDDQPKPLAVAADLSIEKEFAAVIGDRNAGDPISWSLVVANNGPSDSISSADAPIVVTDEVPAEIVDVAQLDGSTLPEGWALQLDGNSITLTLTPDAVFPASGAGSSVQFDFTGTIDASTDAGTEIVNLGVVTPGETPDPNDENNEDPATTDPITSDTTVGAAKHRVELVDGEWVAVGAPSAVTAGTQISYLLSITNTGTADARGVTLSDELPAVLDLTDWEAVAPQDGWTLDQTDNSLTFTNSANLAPGETASVVITAIVNETTTGDIENTVCVDADNSTTDPVDCATDTTGTGKMVDWEIEKSHTSPDSGAVEAGNTVRYLLQVHNNGPSSSDVPITVTDVLPEGFAYAGGVSTTGVGTITDTVVDTTADGLERITWTVAGPFPTGEDVVTIAFDADVAEDVDPGTYRNLVEVDGVELEPGDDPSNNSDTDDVPVVRTATMNIVKEVQDENGDWVEMTDRAAGTDVTWRVAITNEGPSAAPVTFVDELPAGLTMTSMSSDTGWECDELGDPLPNCEYVANDGLHPAGTTSYIEFTSDIASSVPPTDEPGLVNWGRIAWVDSTTEDPTDEDDAAVTVYRAADLGIEKSALDADGDATTTVIAGESLQYRLEVFNDGPSDAVAPLVVHDRLPEGISFAGMLGDGWTAEVDADDPQSVTFTRNPATGILNGESAPAILFEADVDESVAAGQDLENVASIDEETLETNGDPTDGTEAPDSDEAVVTAERLIDLGIEKTHDASAVRVGDELPFTLQVTNYGPSQATEITVTDTIPAGLEVVSEVGPVLDAAGEPSGWTIESITLADEANPAGGATIVASYADPLGAGERAASLKISTLVTPAAYDSVVNVAEVSGAEPEPDPDPNSNRDEDTVIVPPLVTLVVEKTAVESELQVGGTGTFKIKVSNLGPTADPGPITVTDVLPSGLSFQSASPDAQVRGKQVIWVLEGGLAAGESATFTLKVDVGQGAYPEVTNIVSVDSSAELTPDSQLSDSATVTVFAADSLVVTGADFAALWLVLALLLVLVGTALLLRRLREREALTEA